MSLLVDHELMVSSGARIGAAAPAARTGAPADRHPLDAEVPA